MNYHINKPRLIAKINKMAKAKDPAAIALNAILESLEAAFNDGLLRAAEIADEMHLECGDSLSCHADEIITAIEKEAAL